MSVSLLMGAQTPASDEHPASVAFATRVLSPEQMGPVLDWIDLADWVVQQRQLAQDQLQQTLDAERASFLETVSAEINQARIKWQSELAAQQASLHHSMRVKAGQLANELASATAQALREMVRGKPEIAQEFFAATLQQLLQHLGPVSRLVVVVAAQDHHAAQDAFESLNLSSQLNMELVEDAALAPGTCLIRSDEQLYECSLTSWIDSIDHHLKRHADVALAGSALQVSPDNKGTASQESDAFASVRSVDDETTVDVFDLDGEFSINPDNETSLWQEDEDFALMDESEFSVPYTDPYIDQAEDGKRDQA